MQLFACLILSNQWNKIFHSWTQFLQLYTS